LWRRRGHAGVAHWQIYAAVEVGGGERERDSEDRCWREVGEATSVRCGEVMVIPHRMRAGLLGQQEWGLQGRFGCPLQTGGSSRGSIGVLFLDWAPIFSYRGSSRAHAGVALSSFPINNQHVYYQVFRFRGYLVSHRIQNAKCQLL